MSYTIDRTSMRHRVKALEQKTFEPKTMYRPWDSNSGYSGSWVPLGDQAPRLEYRKSIEMWDVVTKDFRRRQARGEIFNNPMIQIEEEFTSKPVFRDDKSGIFQENHRWGNHYTGYYNLGPQEYTLPAPSQRHLDNVLTRAYSEVSANEGNTLLWLGEMKEALKMFQDIGEGLRALYQRTKKQRLAWAKNKLSVKEQQSLTLGLLYGILPLEQQIADFIDGLFETKDYGRHTARGFDVISDTVTKSTYSVDTFNDVDFHSDETITTSIRAGVLYDIDYTNVPWLSVILEPKAVISTAYALARLSFVIDWFVNVGGTLTAWSPSAGTTELAAWVTVETERTVVAQSKQSVTRKPLRTDLFKDQYLELNMSQTRIEKTRYPVNRSDLAIIPRLTFDLNMSKIASLVLLFAKVKNK